MGAASSEQMEKCGLVAYLDHAVAEPCDKQIKTPLWCENSFALYGQLSCNL